MKKKSGLTSRQEFPEMKLSGVRPRMLSLLAALTACMTIISSAQAQTYKVLYSFISGNAEIPSELVRDSAGNFYGTSYSGGTSQRGTVFKIDPSGVETILYSFSGGTDGSNPGGPVTLDAAGNLYGTTELGGDAGDGVVFKIDTSGVETVLHSFHNSDGREPHAGLLLDPAGNLYGTTFFGGAQGRGVVFLLTPGGQERILHSFQLGADAGFPGGGALLRDKAGNFYGTTQKGGAFNNGAVYKLEPNGTETVLYSFTGLDDGRSPYGSLIRDPAGNLYGTATFGGASNRGAVFKLDLAQTLTVLHSFAGPDGQWPVAGLTRDSAGSLYGTASTGGAFQGGVIFRIDSAGVYLDLHDFNAGLGGNSPQSTMLLFPGPNLYGTTLLGGDYGVGVMFRFKP